MPSHGFGGRQKTLALITVYIRLFAVAKNCAPVSLTRAYFCEPVHNSLFFLGV
jgi:hypothetical protein